MDYIAVKKFVDACRRNDVSRARQLIAEGVDINGKYNDYTGLIGAVMKNYREIMNILLACPDIDVNIRDSYGRTALYRAITMDNTEAVGKLLTRGDTRLDYTTIWGNTVLHVACSSVNKEEYVQSILAQPSCTMDIVNKKNNSDETAEKLAERMGYHRCVRLIREYLENDDGGRGEEDGARSVELITLGKDNSEALSSSELDAFIEGFKAMEVTFKEAATTRVNQIRSEITGLENQIMKHKQLLGEFKLKSAADLEEIKKKREDLESLKRRRTVDRSPQTGSRLAQVPECPVCYERMIPPRHIYTCGNGHVICSDCKAKMNETGEYRCINHCGARYSGRATTVEQLIREIMGTK